MTNNLSKLQSEAVLEFDKNIPTLEPDRIVGEEVYFGYKMRIDDQIITVTDWGNIKHFLTDQIQKAYLEGRKEVVSEKDIAEKFLYSNLPLDLSIGTEFEVGGRYEDWGFVVNYKGNKISEGGNLEQAINNAKIKLSIQSKGKIK